MLKKAKKLLSLLTGEPIELRLAYQTQAIVKTVKSSFVITVLGSILIIGALLGNDGGWGRSSVIILLIALYYLLLGLSNLIFVRKRLIYGIAHTGIIYAGLVV